MIPPRRHPPARSPLLAVFLATNLALPIVFGQTSTNESKQPLIDFNRQVRPVLAKHCYSCHGPDEDAREADLRLDTQDGSRDDLGGYQAIMPGDPESSELYLRITTDDEDLRMPPAGNHPPLSKSDIDTVRRWIESGAVYNQHWSFVPPRLPKIPEVEHSQWCRNAIDRFVVRRLEQSGLQPNEEANRKSLIRRVSMDLIGLVPSPEEVSAFVTDHRPDAYERLVDRLLASPAYGERFARSWLDLARYSDTNGYEKDRPRTIWPYRDWVINAINDDLSFDLFSIEQLAGDMLNDATQEQRIATGFHRNTMLNEEGGIDPMEYRFYAMVDRVATTGTVWMGLTTECAQCHTHKFDPITQDDYYALMALMNNADEPEMNADSPDKVIKREEIERQVELLERQTARKLIAKKSDDASSYRKFVEWARQRMGELSTWTTVSPDSMESTMPLLERQSDGSILASGDATKRDIYRLTMPAIQGAVTAIRIEAISHPSLPANGPGLAFYEGRRGDFFLSEVDVAIDGRPIELAVGTTSVPNAGPKNGKTYPGNVVDDDGSTGWSIPGGSGQTHRLVIPLAKPIEFHSDWNIELLFERHYVAGLGHFRIDVTTDSDPTASVLPVELQSRLGQATELDQLSEEDLQLIAIEFLRRAPSMKDLRGPIDALREEIPDTVRTLVMRERPAHHPRETHRHHRGEYLQAKETIEPGVPEVFAKRSASRPSNRLQFARWLVSDDNPLVGRVTVNRAWREFFGTGIVKTSGDFGTQSEAPSHPDLIDYLDYRLRDGSTDGWQWSMKRLHREIVLSSTYRQAIGSPPENDPNNRLLSVFPYRRYDGEHIRDAFLSASSLLSRKIGGESVRPPQPASVTQIAYGNPKWPAATGADRFRRSLYTYSKRTAPFAAFATFDGPSGEVCVAKRDRSTTPLQALTLLNDAMYLEIAAELAEQSIRDCGGADSSPGKIASRMFRRLLSRPPSGEELDSILQFYQSQSHHRNPWMLVARALMNTDEAITTP